MFLSFNHVVHPPLSLSLSLSPTVSLRPLISFPLPLSLDPAIVGKAFVKQYYTQMHRDPSQMHRFYLDQSSFVHGGAEIGSEEPVIGQKVRVCVKYALFVCFCVTGGGGGGEGERRLVW